MKNPFVTLLLFVSATLAFTHCTKKKEEVTPASNQTQSVALRMNPTIGNDPLNFSSVYTTNSGQKYTLSMFRYYVSNIRLVKTDGSEYNVTGKYLLVTPSVSDYALGELPVGDYKGIKFTVGIDSATNHSDPTPYPASHPLAIQSPAMHWSWNSGYIFTMIEGTCDTTVNNTDVLTYGQYSHGMFFHLGMDPLKREVDLSNSAFSISAETSKTIAIKADLNKFFTGIDLKTENTTHTMGTMALATRAANNIPSMFSITQ